MKVLIVGSGGREHALAWKIARSPLVSRVLATPGNAGMARDADCFPEVGASDADAVVALAKAENVDLVVIGPENPLADGLADRLREEGLAVFGPSAAAARLEGSKSWSKRFMARHGIPTAAFEVFDDLAAASAHVRERPGGCVVKADGLAAGKGVFVCGDSAAAVAALDEIMADRRFGEAGACVVIEDRLPGEEASYYAITDGTHVATLAPAQDHKRALDGDRGENTGGMGAYCPAPVVTEAVEKQILETVVHPVIRGMAAEGHPYVGVLYAGLMIDADGAVNVVEFNVRFGDPETQALMLAMEGDFVPLLDNAARGTLDRAAPVGSRDAAVCVVIASGGYPRSFDKGLPIEGLDAAGGLANCDDAVVFHAGSRREGDGFATSGGRVVGVTARGATVREARDRAYAAADRISFANAHKRSDIASRAVDR